MRFYSSTDKRANQAEFRKKYRSKHHKSHSDPIRTWKSIIRRFHKDFDLHTFSNKLPYEFLTETNPIRKTNFEKMPSLAKFKLGALEKKRSLLLWSEKVPTQPKFSGQMMRKTLRDDSQIRIGGGKTLMCERVWYHEIMIPCYTTVLFLSNLFDLSSTTFEISLFLCSSVRRLTLVVLDSSFKTEKLFYKMAISFSELKRCTE